jgi:hypothetical protein
MHKSRHALGLGTMILGMPYTHLLGESTPLQGVNDLILPYPYLIDPMSKVVGLVQFVQSAQDILHHVQ